MTNEEMIAKFKNIILSEIYRLETKYDEEVKEEVIIDTNALDELLQLNKFFANAVKKQMPKKPFRVTDNIYHCGKCKGLIKADGKWCDEYCDHCGQAIDWRESDNEFAFECDECEHNVVKGRDSFCSIDFTEPNGGANKKCQMRKKKNLL